jgi:ribosomal protein S18 acetylase RimI-like enzyme
MPYVLKPLTPQEYPAIVDVYRRCGDFLALGPEYEASLEMVLQDIHEAAVEGGLYRGIYTGQELIGVISYVPSHFEFKTVDVFILLLMLAAEHRGKGIGGAIVDMVEKEICTHARIRSIRCGVQVNNPRAIRFWEKKGYQIFSGPTLQPDKTTVYLLRKQITPSLKT